VSRFLLLSVVSLALGLVMGARVLPAAFQKAVDIRPEGDHGVYRFGPFVAGTFESSSGITVGTEGEIQLALDEGWYENVGQVELPRTTPAAPFDTVQLGIEDSTPMGTDLFVQVRTTDLASGLTSRWQTMPREGELLLVKPARDFQVRLVLNSFSGRDTPRVRGVIIQAVRREVESVTTEPGDQADVQAPEMVTREMWGARPPKDPYNSQEPLILTVHHASSPNYAQYQGASSIRGIQSFHMNDRGWSDIGYHYVVGPEGKLYEGRPPTAIGAHSPPNSNKVGICLIGNFENVDTLKPEQRATLVKLLAHLCGKFRIPVAKIKGHRDFQSTDCPGSTVYAQLDEIRKDVADTVAAAR
jgi:hypothetical protein